MKRKKYLSLMTLIGVAFALFTSCDLNDVLKEDDGSDMTLLRVDFPTFDGTYALKTINAITGEPYMSDITVKVSGKSADKIITDMGKKNDGIFKSSGGDLYLYLDPNEKVANEKVEFKLTGADKNCAIIPFSITQSLSGVYNGNIGVIPNTYLKSATSNNDRGYTVWDKNGTSLPILWFSTPFIYGETLAVGIVNSSEDPSSFIAKNVPAGTIVSFKRENDITFICETKHDGKAITVTINLTAANKNTETSGYYKITTTDDLTISGELSGTLPITRNVENVYSSGSITIEYFTTPPYINNSKSITIANPSATESANFEISLDPNTATNYYNYYLNLELFYNSDNSQIIGAPTKPFKVIKKADLGDESKWITGQLDKGKAHLRLENNTDYFIMVNVNSKWYEYFFNTNPDKISEIIEGHQDKIKKITMEPVADGYNFTFVVYCDDLSDLL